MRLSELLLRLDDQLDDPGKNNWSEAERIRWADLVVGDLNRQLIEVDKGYCDLELFVLDADWTKEMNLMLDYRLPQWVGNIVDVWRLSTDPDHQNPFVNTIDTQRGSPINKTSQYNDPGWLYTQRNVLRLSRFTSEQNVAVTAAKRPAKLLRVTLTSDATGAAIVEIPQALGADDAGSLHLEHDWYRNEQFYVLSTTQDPATHAVVGTSGRCVRSEANVLIGGALYTRLTFDADWADTLVTGDVLELELWIPDEHSELVVLEVCAKAFIKKESTDGLAAIASDRALARDSYRRYIEPRGVREPDFYKTDGIRQATDWVGKDPAMEQYL